MNAGESTHGSQQVWETLVDVLSTVIGEAVHSEALQYPTRSMAFNYVTATNQCAYSMTDQAIMDLQ